MSLTSLIQHGGKHWIETSFFWIILWIFYGEWITSQGLLLNWTILAKYNTVIFNNNFSHACVTKRFLDIPAWNALLQSISTVTVRSLLKKAVWAGGVTLSSLFCDNPACVLCTFLNHENVFNKNNQNTKLNKKYF